MAFSYGHSCSTSTRCHYHWKLEHIWNFNQMTIKTMILGVCLNVREQIAFSDVLIINLEAPCYQKLWPNLRSCKAYMQSTCMHKSM